jgi:hypothetical protein
MTVLAVQGIMCTVVADLKCYRLNISAFYLFIHIFHFI